jgi:hypothetical protein
MSLKLFAAVVTVVLPGGYRPVTSDPVVITATERIIEVRSGASVAQGPKGRLRGKAVEIIAQGAWEPARVARGQVEFSPSWWSGELSMEGADFAASARRAVVDPDANTLTLEGSEVRPARYQSPRRSVSMSGVVVTQVVQSSKVVINLGGGPVRVEQNGRLQVVEPLKNPRPVR